MCCGLTTRELTCCGMDPESQIVHQTLYILSILLYYSIFVAFWHATLSNYCFYKILQESFNRLSYLLDVFTFTQDDMSLNSTVLNWPKKIAPIFDQNDEVLFIDQNIFFFIFGSGRAVRFLECIYQMLSHINVAFYADCCGFTKEK